MIALNEYTAIAINHGVPTLVLRQIRAVHEREAAQIAINTLKDEGGCSRDTVVVISELFSRRERSLTVKEWTHRPD